MFHNGSPDCPLLTERKPVPFILGFTPLQQQLAKAIDSYWLLPHPRLSRYHWHQQDKMLFWGSDPEGGELFAFQWLTQLLPAEGIVSQGIVISLSGGFLFLGLFAARYLQIPCWIILDRTPKTERQELKWVLEHPHPRSPVIFILQGLCQPIQADSYILPPSNSADWHALFLSPQKK